MLCWLKVLVDQVGVYWWWLVVSLFEVVWGEEGCSDVHSVSFKTNMVAVRASLSEKLFVNPG